STTTGRGAGCARGEGNCQCQPNSPQEGTPARPMVEKFHICRIPSRAHVSSERDQAMLRLSIGCATAVALVLLHSSLRAQVPGVPAVPAAGGAAGAAGATGAAPAAAPPSNIWSMLCPTPAQCQACMQKLCACPLVQFMGGAMTPVSAVSGGLMPSCCPGPNTANPADLQKPADGALGAAARIKAKEAEAKARRAAVRYLGTVDC